MFTVVVVATPSAIAEATAAVVEAAGGKAAKHRVVAANAVELGFGDAEALRGALRMHRTTLAGGRIAVMQGAAPHVSGDGNHIATLDSAMRGAAVRNKASDDAGGELELTRQGWAESLPILGPLLFRPPQRDSAARLRPVKRPRET